MKILFWAEGFWPRIGGSETQGFRLVQELQRRGHLCQVIAQKDSSLQEGEIYSGIPIKRFDFDQIIKNRELKNLRPIREHLEWIVLEFQPDIILLNTFAEGSAAVFLLLSNLFQAPIIATAHAPYYWEDIPPLVAEICNRVHLVCCVSKWALGMMNKLLPSLKDKFQLVYNGLPMPTISPSPLPFSPPTILLLGRLSSEKGFDTALEAFSLLKKGGDLDTQLLIAGEGPERPYLDHLVDKLGLRRFSRFIGKVPLEEVPALINQATFAVMASHFEAFGLVALECLQMGRPVIASSVGALPEIITDQKTGLLVPPQDPLALSEAMKKLLMDPEKTIEMGREGYNQSSIFTLQQNVEHYEALFNETPCHSHYGRL